MENNIEPKIIYDATDEPQENGYSDDQYKHNGHKFPTKHQNGYIETSYKPNTNYMDHLRRTPNPQEDELIHDTSNVPESFPVSEMSQRCNEDQDDKSAKSPYFEEVDDDKFFKPQMNNTPSRITPMLNILDHISKPQSSAGKSSNAPTEAEAEKIESIDQEQNHTGPFSNDEDLPKSNFGKTRFLNSQNGKEDDDNSPQSARSTVLINESPQIEDLKDDNERNKRQLEKAFGAQELEDTTENKTNPLATIASKAIANVVTHNGPLLQPKPQEVAQANIATMKNKINLEVYLKVENLLYSIKENIMSGKPIFKICRDYIEVAPKIDRENFEKLLKVEKEKKLIKSSFILKRLAVILMLYFTVENTPNEKTMFQLKSLINTVHQNFIIFGYLVSLKLKDKGASNVWVSRLFELLEHDATSNFERDENLDKVAYNNNYLMTVMKTLIVTMKNKEILYAYNSVVVQLDRIPMKEAYTRLLKSFSVFMSEKELKSQTSQYHPKRPTKDIKAVKTTKQKEKEKEKKETMAFLPKINLKGDDEQSYTLVVDLDETLVHYAEIPGKFNELRVRPYVSYFLTEVSKYYEIVVFTAAMQEYADWVLDNIDKEHCITHRLYRQHASPDGYNFVKDLSKIGRDITKTMIIDNLAENFRLQPDNGIYIKPWYDDHEDTALYELTPLLVEIAQNKVTDVRIALRQFRDQMLQNIESGSDNPHLNLKLD